MTYMILDTESGNVVETFATLGEALQVAHETAKEFGPEAVAAWALEAFSIPGFGATVAIGPAILTVPYAPVEARQAAAVG
jgi:hypothetical protein